MPSFPRTAQDIFTGSHSVWHAGAAAAVERTVVPALSRVSSRACQALPLAVDTFHFLRPCPRTEVSLPCYEAPRGSMSGLPDPVPATLNKRHLHILLCRPCHRPLSNPPGPPSGSCPGRVLSQGLVLGSAQEALPSLQLSSSVTSLLSSPRRGFSAVAVIPPLFLARSPTYRQRWVGPALRRPSAT